MGSSVLWEGGRGGGKGEGRGVYMTSPAQSQELLPTFSLSWDPYR